MTYNFDPELWYETHLNLLTKRRDAGELDQPAFDEAVEQLDRDYDRMLARLDDSYQLPPEPDDHTG